MTAKKKSWSHNPLSHDTGHGDNGLTGNSPTVPPLSAPLHTHADRFHTSKLAQAFGALHASKLSGSHDTLAAVTTPKAAPLAPTTDSISKVYQHWADGDAATGSTAEWNNNILSANKSDYSEGEVIPHLFAFKASNNAPLVHGQTYSFNITYNYYQGNTNAGGFTGLTTFDLSRHPTNWPVDGAPSADSTFVNNGGTAGLFYTVGADITKVSNVTYTSSNNKDGHVTVTFVYTGPTTTKGSAEIYYGLKIAGPGDVPDQGHGATNGAHLWTGGSLQTTVDIGGSGSTSLQLSPSAILYPGLAIDKTVIGVFEADGVTPDSDGIVDHAGEIIKYNVEVTNTGQTKLTGVTVKDPLTGQDISGVTLAVGAHADYASQYTVTQADLDTKGGGDGCINNTATADSDQTTPVSDSECTPVQYAPKLGITKTYDGVTGGNDNNKIDLPGELLHYTVTVTNTGNISLTGVTVTDPLTGQDISGVSLAPGASQSYQSTYTLTQADLDNNGGGDGKIDNTATADSNETDPVSASAAAPLDFTPGLGIAKQVLGIDGGNGNTVADAAGDVIHYRVTLTNTDGQTLTNVTLTDPLTGQAISGVTLAAGASQSFDSSYVLKQSDLDNNGGGDGKLDNTATGDSDQTDPVSASAAVPLVYAPGMSIAKSYDGVTGGNDNNKIDLPGELLHYTVSVTNTGNVTLSGVTVTDPLTGQNLSGITLGVGETQSFASTYTLTQADLDNNGGGDGKIDNTATADSNETDPVSASAAAPLDFTPGLGIAKQVLGIDGGNGNTVADAAGDVIHYRVTLTNTDGQTLTNVTLVDPLTGQNLSGITLAAGESKVFDSSYVLKQSDLDTKGGGDGNVDNTATADSDQTDPVSASAAVPLVYAPGMAIDKVFDNVTGGNGNAVADAAGDVLNYHVLVTNTGNITLTDVTVVDPLTGQNISGITVAPGTTQSFGSSYTLTQTDLDTNGGGDGHIENTATADSAQTDPVSDTELVNVNQRPSLTINKTLEGITGGNGNALADAAGDILNYGVTVANAGNVTLTNVSVVDPLTGQDIGGITLAPGASQTFLSSYTLKQSDLDNNGGGDGSIDNTATADSDQTAPIIDAESVQLARNAGLQITKSLVDITGGNGNVLADAAGDNLNYQIVVANVGNVTLHNVLTTSSLNGFSDTLASLAPGESHTYLSTYVLQQSDLDTNGGGDGTLDNVAVSTADEAGPTTDTETVQLFVSPVMYLNKIFTDVTGGNGNAIADARGDQLNYKIVLANPGNVTLTNVTLDEGLTNLHLSGLTLAPGTSNVYTTSYTLTQADLDSNGGGDGYIDNTCTATSSQTKPVMDGDQVPLVLTKLMSFNESFTGVTNGNGNALADAAGDVLNFHYVIQNQGNVTLTNVHLTDPLTGVDLSGISIAPGATAAYDGTYTLTQADLDSNGGGDGRIESTSTVTSDQTQQASDTETATVVYDPQVDLKKFVSVDGGATWEDANSPTGPTATSAPAFKFVVSNTGTVTLGDVLVNDSTYDLNGAAAGTAYDFVALAPGQSKELVFTDTTLQIGQQVNTATVTVVGMPSLDHTDNAYYVGVAA